MRSAGIGRRIVGPVDQPHPALAEDAQNAVGADARRMLELLSGRTHAVLTGLAVVTGRKVARDLEITQVTFNCIDAAELAQYIASGEPLDKAGAYAIQGYAARWIPRIEGCYFNVVGLPIARTIALLAEAQTESAAEKA